MTSDRQQSSDQSKSSLGSGNHDQGRSNVHQLSSMMSHEAAQEALVETTEQKAPKQHLVLAGIERGMDDFMARAIAEKDSRIQDRPFTRRDDRTLKGDAGEARTRNALRELYDAEQITHQPHLTTDAGKNINPDFVVRRDKQSDELIEVVDSKAWSLSRPKDAQGNRLSDDDFFRYLQQRPPADKLLYMNNLRNVVENYASTPQLASDGKVVLYFPENVMRYAPQIKQEIESWSGTAIAHGRAVEVRSMGVWDEDLWADVHKRRQNQQT
ncbi:MAG: hypothetical protein JXA21_07410 [Anaerolineae bacterium]|nr:hypothetical protein [Anaerolineae bacterium]